MLIDAIYMRIGIVVAQNCMYIGRKNAQSSRNIIYVKSTLTDAIYMRIRIVAAQNCS